MIGAFGMVIISRCRTFIAEEISGEMLLFKAEDGEARERFVMILNETGAFLWNALFEPTSVEKLAELLSQKYQINIDQARNDVNEFLVKCEAEGMVQKMDS